MDARCPQIESKNRTEDMEAPTEKVGAFLRHGVKQSIGKEKPQKSGRRRHSVIFAAF